MKSPLKKLILMMSVLMLVMSSFLCVRADEEDGTVSITATYYVVTTQQDRSLEVPFNPSWFMSSARYYNHDLAKLSLGLTVSAFRPNAILSDPEREPDTSAISFLDQAGFSGIQSDDYDKNPSIYTVSTIMGHQQIGEGEDAFELIAVGVCGQGYLDEWESNFSIVDDEEDYTVHAGFDHSSRLVYDRIFGYIASHHLSGPIKIWITGFSRAAAVSNVTAARLCDTDLFSEDTVFAYTFATPRTTREPQYGRYMNIYNIIGKSDPVPLIPFADWGYDRYGTTLMTPCIETDSDFSEKRTRANAIYKEITGIDFWVNPDMDKQIRIILDYFLKLSPDVLIYHRSLQNGLINLWADHTPISILSNLLTMASDPLLVNEDNRHEANALLDYITYLIMDATASRNSFRLWNDEASLGSNMAQAHTPELYISWVFSSDDGLDLYNDSSTFNYLFIEGNVDIDLLRDGEIVESLYADEPEGRAGNNYLMRTEKTVTAQIPSDVEYDLHIRAAGDTMLSIMHADYEIGHHSPEETTTRFYDLLADSELNLTLRDGVLLSPQGEDSSEEMLFESDEYLDNTAFISFERSNMFGLTWRTMVMLSISAVILALSLIMFQIIWLILRFRFRHLQKIGWIHPNEKFRSLPVHLLYMIFHLFLLGEFFITLFPEAEAAPMIVKTVIGMLSVIAATIGYKREPTPLARGIQYALILFTAADVTTRINLRIGACLHICAYLYLTYVYCREEKPVAGQIRMWILLSLIAVAMILLQRNPDTGGVILSCLYVCAALMMICASFQMQRKCFISSLVLFAGGILLIINNVVGEQFLNHITALGTYYAGIVILASVSLRLPLARLVPVYDNTPPEHSAEEI